MHTRKTRSRTGHSLKYLARLLLWQHSNAATFSLHITRDLSRRYTIIYVTSNGAGPYLHRGRVPRHAVVILEYAPVLTVVLRTLKYLLRKMRVVSNSSTTSVSQESTKELRGLELLKTFGTSQRKILGDGPLASNTARLTERQKQT